MSIFQIIILFITAWMIIRALQKVIKKEMSNWLFFLWIFFWLSILFINLFPETLSWLANKVGIGRGVDLLIYLSIITLFYFAFRYNLRLKKHEQKISELVQKIAIEKAKDNRLQK